MSGQIDLTGRNILVTGGSRGIGRAAATISLRSGARVVICARTSSDVEATVQELREAGLRQVRGLAADVTDAGDLDAALDMVEDHFGPVHGLVHAAAVLGPIGLATELDPGKWFDALRINLFGTFLAVRQSARRMVISGGGRIVLFSGGGAATPFPRYTSYACAKTSVVRLTETLAEELGPLGIEINCVAPGFVATQIHNDTLDAGDAAGCKYLERTKALLAEGGVSPEVGGSAAAFMISDAANGVTGKFVAAPHDSWLEWPRHLRDLQTTDIFTLRRILPTDRGMGWH